jgi:hypothetical protein
MVSFFGVLYISMYYTYTRGEWSIQDFLDLFDYISGTSQENCFIENTLVVANPECYSLKIVFR